VAVRVVLIRIVAHLELKATSKITVESNRTQEAYAAR